MERVGSYVTSLSQGFRALAGWTWRRAGRDCLRRKCRLAHFPL